MLDDRTGEPLIQRSTSYMRPSHAFSSDQMTPRSIWPSDFLGLERERERERREKRERREREER